MGKSTVFFSLLTRLAEEIGMRLKCCKALNPLYNRYFSMAQIFDIIIFELRALDLILLTASDLLEALIVS